MILTFIAYPANYGDDPYTRNKINARDQLIQKIVETRTDGKKDTTDFSTLLANVVGKCHSRTSYSVLFCSVAAV